MIGFGVLIDEALEELDSDEETDDELDDGAVSRIGRTGRRTCANATLETAHSATDAERTERGRMVGMPAFYRRDVPAYTRTMHVDMTPAECEKLLAEGKYAHLGCVDGGQPYVFPITYAYERGVLYGVTMEGTKIRIMRANPSVCVQVERVASESDWESVMCFGEYEEITDHDEVQRLKLLLGGVRGKAVLAGEDAPVTAIPHAAHRPEREAVAYRVKPTRMTGKAAKR